MLQCDATHVQASPGLSASAGSEGGRQGSKEVTSMGEGGDGREEERRKREQQGDRPRQWTCLYHVLQCSD